VAERSGATGLTTVASNASNSNGAVIRQSASRPASADERRLSAAIERQRKELQQLQRAHDDLTRKVEALEKRANSWRGALDQLKDLPQQRQALESQLQSARVQQVSGVVGNLQAAAFGDAGSVFTRNNLFLAGNQLFWIFLDPVLRQLGVIRGTSPGVVRWLAPVGSLLTGQLALANQQHVRFISGVATVTPGTVTLDTLRDRIADGFWEKFQRRTDIAVTAVALDQQPFVPFAEVRQGVLRVGVTPLGKGVGEPPDTGGLLLVSVPSLPQRVRVAWIVDTGVASG